MTWSVKENVDMGLNEPRIFFGSWNRPVWWRNYGLGHHIRVAHLFLVFGQDSLDFQLTAASLRERARRRGNEKNDDEKRWAADRELRNWRQAAVLILARRPAPPLAAPSACATRQPVVIGWKVMTTTRSKVSSFFLFSGPCFLCVCVCVPCQGRVSGSKKLKRHLSRSSALSFCVCVRIGGVRKPEYRHFD